MGRSGRVTDHVDMGTITASIARARRMADTTPPERNRYVDFLRALSIFAVVVGHWLIAAPYLTGEGLQGVNMLARSPWTQWLTWVFQVMPVFFAVGGYSNTVSWWAARAKGQTYGLWLTARLRRLAIPVAALVGVWGLLGMALTAFGVDPSLVKIGSQAALVPVWFLAVYMLITLLGPLMVMAWERWGWASFAALAAAAAAIDLAGSAGADLAGWLNFLFVWSAIHQLGVAWARGSMAGSHARRLAVIAAAVVVGLVTFGPYPIAMVGVPGAEASNNSPPTIAMIAFGTMQVGGLLALETRAKRMLAKPVAWTATILVNGMIMSLYLWHLTVLAVMVGISLLAGGPGLGIEPATGLWWATRPLWIALLAVVTFPLVAFMSRLEQVKPLPSSARPNSRTAIATGLALSLGLALLAGAGIQGPSLGINPIAVGLPILAGLAMMRAGRRPVDVAPG